jgi:hypothetical protein
MKRKDEEIQIKDTDLISVTHIMMRESNSDEGNDEEI